MSATLELLRRAGEVLVRAGMHSDLVREIELAIGEVFVRGLPPVADRQRRLRDGMARVADALAKAGRPLTAAELSAAGCWSGASLWQTRGMLTHCVAEGWIEAEPKPPGSKGTIAYRIGRCRTWATAATAELERCRAELEAAQKRLAELTAGQGARP